MTTRPSQEIYTGDQAAVHKMYINFKSPSLFSPRDDVFNSDDNEGTKDDNGYDSNSYEQFIRAIKTENLIQFRDILSNFRGLDAMINVQNRCSSRIYIKIGCI